MLGDCPLCGKLVSAKTNRGVLCVQIGMEEKSGLPVTANDVCDRCYAAWQKSVQMKPAPVNPVQKMLEAKYKPVLVTKYMTGRGVRK